MRCSCGVAAPRDIDLAMTKRRELPEGTARLGRRDRCRNACSRSSSALRAEYGEDRYRPSPLLRRMVRDGRRFLA